MATESSETIALRLNEGIKAAFQPLLEFPRMGAERKMLGLKTRVIFHGNYAVYYRSLPDAVEIVRVLHAKRDTKIFAEGNI